MDTATITHSDTRSWAILEQARRENKARQEALEKKVSKHFSKLIFDHCLEQTLESAKIKQIDRVHAPRSLFGFWAHKEVYLEALELSDAQSSSDRFAIKSMKTLTKSSFQELVKAYNETHPNLKIGHSIKWSSNKRCFKVAVWPKK